MGVVLTIAAKEFRGLAFSAVAYIFLLVFGLVLTGAWFGWGSDQGVTFFRLEQLEFGSFFSQMPLALAALVPALSMKLWPDEMKSGTIELLMSYPIRAWQIVLGKFLAGLLLILVALAITLVVPWVVSGYVDDSLDMGPILGAYLASILLGGAFLAMGLFFGALAREQVTAFIITALFCGALVLFGEPKIKLLLPEEVSLIGLVDLPVHAMSDTLSFSTRFAFLGKGVVPYADVAYLALFGVLFLVLNVTVLECRKGK